MFWFQQTRLLHCINTLKDELNDTKAYEETSIDENSVVYNHLIEIRNKFAVDVNKRQDKFPTMYWLPKLHKRPYKARFIANFNSCTTCTTTDNYMEVPNKFAVDVNKCQDRFPTMYWLPKLHKRPYKDRFIANFSSCSNCTTTDNYMEDPQNYYKML